MCSLSENKHWLQKLYIQLKLMNCYVPEVQNWCLNYHFNSQHKYPTATVYTGRDRFKWIEIGREKV